MTARENILKAIRFENPETIPIHFAINAACWHHYDPDQLQDLMAAHPLLFPDFERKTTVEPEYLLNQRADHPYTDPWGCVWETTDDGITGAVRGHPLADWSDLPDYPIPDPAETDGTYPIDWDALREEVREKKTRGELVWGSFPHGHLFLRLQDIRGFENLTYDMQDGEPGLDSLIAKVEAFNQDYVRRWLALEPDMIGYPEDLGMQSGPMLAPRHFRRYFKPVYQRLMKPALDQGCIVHMHCDGDIRTLASDLLDCGVQVLNLQDLVNGIDWIGTELAGRVCLHLDIDRQNITVRGSPGQIDSLIREEVDKLGSPQGGLMLLYGLYPGVPVENVAAVMDAMERYADFYS